MRPAEILLNCARDLSLLDLVLLIDGALHRGDVSTDELILDRRDAAARQPCGREALPLARRTLGVRVGVRCSG